MTITQTTTAQSDYAAIVPEIDSIDFDFERWEWTQAMTEHPDPREEDDSLSAEEAAYCGII